MAVNNTSLKKAGPWSIGDSISHGVCITRIELRTDGHGLSGLYDMIYLYATGSGIVVGEGSPWAAMPAHNTDFWEYA